MEQARGDELGEELGEFLRMAVLDDPKEDGGAEVLLGLPALEGGGEILGIAALDEKIDGFGGKLARGGLEQREEEVAGFDGVRLLDEFEEAALELDGNLFRDVGQRADIGDQGGLARRD
jgi:hypothetical protein